MSDLRARFESLGEDAKFIAQQVFIATPTSSTDQNEFLTQATIGSAKTVEEVVGKLDRQHDWLRSILEVESFFDNTDLLLWDAALGLRQRYLQDLSPEKLIQAYHDTQLLNLATTRLDFDIVEVLVEQCLIDRQSSEALPIITMLAVQALGCDNQEGGTVGSQDYAKGMAEALRMQPASPLLDSFLEELALNMEG